MQHLQIVEVHNRLEDKEIQHFSSKVGSGCCEGLTMHQFELFVQGSSKWDLFWGNQTSSKCMGEF